MGLQRIFGPMLIGEGIEIGALNHPMEGVAGKVRYADYKSTADLRAEYPELADQGIVHVDYVTSYETLSAFAGVDTQDFIIANQTIEHFANPLLALREFNKTLKVGGLLHLAVPDKRGTFDCERPVTPLEHLIEDEATYGTPEFDARNVAHYDEFAKLAPRYMINSQPTDDLVRRDKYLAYMADSAALQRDKMPIHFHVWTDREWPAIINYLNQTGTFYELVDHLNISSPTERNEFVLILRKTSAPAPILPSRLPERGPLKMKLIAILRRFIFLNHAKYYAKRLLGHPPHFRPC